MHPIWIYLYENLHTKKPIYGDINQNIDRFSDLREGLPGKKTSELSEVIECFVF